MARQIRRRFLYLVQVVAGLLLLALAGCGDKARIEGVVLDNFSQPVAGVEVQIAGTTLAVETDARGRYAIPYYPGSVRVVYRKGGYQQASREFKVTGETVIPAEPVGLFKHPPKGQGVWFEAAAEYVPLEPASTVALVEKEPGTRYRRVWTYHVGDEITEIEIDPALRIGESNRYMVDLAVILPEFVLLEGQGSTFRFQPRPELEEQVAGVPRVQTGSPLHSIVVEPDRVYAVVSLGAEPCEFIHACKTLEKPAYRFRPKLPGG